MSDDNTFYEKEHTEYFASTVNVDPASILTPLTALLQPGATILDIGCGSGRDLAWLAEKGFRPTGFEHAPGLVKCARNHAKQAVIEGDFNDYDFSTMHFDALILVGALVHLEKPLLVTTLKSMYRALNPNGLMLLTLKEGSGIRITEDGRFFVLWTQEEVEERLRETYFTVLDFSRQVSKLRPEDTWLGYVLQMNDGD